MTQILKSATDDTVLVASSIPGRTRFRVERMRRIPGLAERLEQTMRQQSGVLAASASALTGGLLVLFEPSSTTSSALQSRLEQALAAPPRNLRRGNGKSTSQEQPEVAEPAQGALTVTRQLRKDVQDPGAEAGEDVPWHTLAEDSVAARLRTDPNRGLSPQQAARRLSRGGRNEVPDIPRRPRSAILAEQVMSVPGLMLSAASAFSLLTGAAIDALFIGGAVVANAAIGFFTEDYAERSIQSLRQVRTPHARVLRDGRRTKVPLNTVAPGDILLLEPGHVVAADGRVIRAEGLVLDESLLTGESAGQPKFQGALRRIDVPLADRGNMVYAGSAVESGKGAAIVTATGMSTELGRIRALIGEAPDTPPPMSRELQKLGGTLALVSTAACAAFAVAGVMMGLPILEILTVSASLAVSAIPEGLPTVATTTLALGMKRMRSQNVVMRRLPAVAALGSSTVFCVDKTGTLTENRMSVRCFVIDADETEVVGTTAGDGVRFIRRGQTVAPQDDPVLISALEICALCTEADLQQLPGGEVEAVGSATEQALLLTAVSAGIDVQRLRSARAVRDVKLRSAGRNYMASLHSSPDGGLEALVKGAPEEVLALCSHERTATGESPLTPRRAAILLASNARLAARGMRVLGLARARLADGEVWTEGDRKLSWVGLVAMHDPVRGGAREAIDQLRQAGIRTIMLTGDQPLTAETVGRAVGLGAGGPLRVGDGSAISDCLASGQPLPDVLARVSPGHKYEIVRMLQERGHVVMMTGDGVNDAPALKAAEVGIAMGVRSTQIARDLADVILLDDNLASVPIAVGHGRTIYANIRKALRFLLASNLADIGLVGTSLALGLPFPLTAIQLLWMNLVTDIFPAIALSMEAQEPGVMSQPPRPPHEPILTPSLWKIVTRESGLIAAATMATYALSLSRYGAGARARTVAFSTITMAEIAYALACRTERPDRVGATSRPNRYLATCLALSAAAQVLTIALPPLRLVLGTVPLAMGDWLAVAAASGTVLVAAEALKRLPPAPADKPRALLLPEPSG